MKVAIEKAGYTGKVQIGMDVAASEFYENGNYNLDFKSKEPNPALVVTSDQLTKIYLDMIKNYPVVSIEDAFDQDDWEGYQHMTAQLGQKVQIVGDDLLVTNQKRIATGIQKKSCNALLLKVNQIGSVTESIAAY